MSDDDEKNDETGTPATTSDSVSSAGTGATSDSATTREHADEAPSDAPADVPTTHDTNEHAIDAPSEISEAKDPAAPPEPPAREPASTLSASSDALFEALWKRVLEAWDDDKPHAAILEHAMRSEMLPELAGRYRAEKDVVGHELRAKKKLDALVIAATQMLMATKTEKAPKTPWQLTVSVAIVCVIVLVWVAYKVFRP